jgi:MFS family permease
MQIPSNMIASKIKNPGAYICMAMAVWGAICSCTAAAQSFSGLVAARFFLGIVEAVFFPGVIFYISLFYTRQQMALRTAIFFSGSQLGNAIGPLIAIGILELGGKQGISGWRWLYIIEGVVTIFFALIFAIILPGSLQNVRGMSKLENQALLYNYAIDIGQQDHKDEASVTKGFVLAARDPKTWFLTAILWAVSDSPLRKCDEMKSTNTYIKTYVAASVVNWFPSLVGTLGYSRNTTYGLTAVRLSMSQ